VRRHDDPAIAGKILRRCSLCGKFHASYLVEDPDEGELFLCHACWHRRNQPSETSASPPEGGTQVERQGRPG
jgi:hypothetical protein